MRTTYLLCLGLAVATLGGCATFRRKTDNPIDRLNTEALAEYEAGHSPAARDKLMKALALAHERGLDKSVAGARTWLYLGVVHAGGLKQPGKAVDEMARALGQDPTLTLPDRLFKDARVKRAFTRADAKAKRTLASNGARTAKAAPLEKPEPVSLASAAPATKKDRRGAASRPGGKGRKAGKPETAVAAAPPPPPPPSPQMEEAAVPMPLPEPIYCPLPDEVPPGQPISIWCAVDASIRPSTVVVQIRAAAETEFKPFTATRTPKGWYAATVDGAVVKAGMLQYYVEARGANAAPMAVSGTFESPEILLVREGAGTVPPVLTVARLEAVEHDDAPETTAASADSPPTAPPRNIENEDPFARPETTAGVAPVTGSRFWIGLQLALGYGWHPAAEFELNSTIGAPSGFAATSLLTLLPEVGYRLNQNFTVGLQARNQFISAEGTAPPGSAPANGAHSILLRGEYRWFERSAFALATSASLGGGEGFRLVYGPDVANGRTGTDTIRGGQFLFGSGILGTYRIQGKLSAAAEARLLFGLPDFAALAEFSAGVRYDL